MPICKNCNIEFPNKICIEGKKRNLSSRLYCLVCSPFGAHNTRPLDSSRIEGVCRECNREFDYGRSSGHRTTRCNTCINNNKRRKLKEKAVELKGSKCSICDYDRCLNALDFHHIKDKSFGIGNGFNRSWESIVKELGKCILLCRNCHAEVHAGIVILDESYSG